MKIKFEPRDIWIGLYWTAGDGVITFYLCLIPMLPIIFTIKRNHWTK